LRVDGAARGHAALAQEVARLRLRVAAAAARPCRRPRAEGRAGPAVAPDRGVAGAGAGAACQVYTASKEILEEIQGAKINTGDAIYTLVAFPVSSPLEELLANPPVVVLDDVRNAENIGSILRTAFCLGITSVIVSPTAAGALRDTRAGRCSMGTMFFHRYYLAADICETIGAVKRRGITVYAAEIGQGSVPVHPHGADREWAVVMGNEDTGVPKETMRCCDELVMIPQASGDSLNVGHAAAICLYTIGSASPQAGHDGRGACV